MTNNIGKYVISKGDTVLSEMFADIMPANKDSKKIYEVIRIINEKPLFLTDHYERLVSSFLVIGQNITMSIDEFRDSITKLISVNDVQNCNVMLEIYGDAKQDRVLYIRASSYPTESMYETGVCMTTLQLMRDLPEAKIWDSNYKAKVEEKLAKEKCYEVILINDKGLITEGSRSNIFFVIGDKIYTAPKECVLRGITSKYAAKACKDAGYELISELVSAKDLGKIDAAFMTGTSVNILPISQIDDIKLDSANNTAVKSVMKEFEKYII
jgi:branched-chain amino acid aminotransferase